MALNFLDTNIIIYAFSDDARSATAQALMAEPFIISTQTLNEFSNIGRRKLRLSWDQIREAVDEIIKVATAVVPVDRHMTLSAISVADRYNLAIYDALLITAALQTNCERFYSEDMHHGLIVDQRLTIVNPFLRS